MRRSEGIHTRICTKSDAHTHTHTLLYIHTHAIYEEWGRKGESERAWAVDTHAIDSNKCMRLCEVWRIVLQRAWIKRTKWQSKVMGLIRVQCVIINLKNNCCQADCVWISYVDQTKATRFHCMTMHATRKMWMRNRICVYLNNDQFIYPFDTWKCHGLVLFSKATLLFCPRTNNSSDWIRRSNCSKNVKIVAIKRIYDFEQDFSES